MAIKQVPVIDAAEATQSINYNESGLGLNQVVELPPLINERVGGNATQAIRTIEVNGRLESIENTGQSELLVSFDTVEWASVAPGQTRAFGGQTVASVHLRCVDITTSFVLIHGGTQ